MAQKEILKRDGSKEEFFPYKIEDAIKKAFKSENKPYDKSIFDAVMDEITFKKVTIKSIAKYLAFIPYLTIKSAITPINIIASLCPQQSVQGLSFSTYPK